MPFTIRLPNALVRRIVQFTASTASYFACCIKQKKKRKKLGQSLVTDVFSYEFIIYAGFYEGESVENLKYCNIIVCEFLRFSVDSTSYKCITECVNDGLVFS